MSKEMKGFVNVCNCFLYVLAEWLRKDELETQALKVAELGIQLCGMVEKPKDSI
jgi:hypothetical protein